MRQGQYRCRDCQRSLVYTFADDPIVADNRCNHCGGVLQFDDRRSGIDRRGPRLQRAWDPEPRRGIERRRVAA
jgi:DNA-directed RNA polymerase subunit RPC12/RpoP